LRNGTDEELAIGSMQSSHHFALTKAAKPDKALRTRFSSRTSPPEGSSPAIMAILGSRIPRGADHNAIVKIAVCAFNIPLSWAALGAILVAQD
jgi:hypothetical protein